MSINTLCSDTVHPLNRSKSLRHDQWKNVPPACMTFTIISTLSIINNASILWLNSSQAPYLARQSITTATQKCAENSISVILRTKLAIGPKVVETEATRYHGHCFLTRQRSLQMTQATEMGTCLSFRMHIILMSRTDRKIWWIENSTSKEKAVKAFLKDLETASKEFAGTYLKGDVDAGPVSRRISALHDYGRFMAPISIPSSRKDSIVIGASTQFYKFWTWPYSKKLN